MWPITIVTEMGTAYSNQFWNCLWELSMAYQTEYNQKLDWEQCIANPSSNQNSD